MFTHLHCHSNYSFLEGASRVDELVARAGALGMSALALTDTNGLYGAVPFYKVARGARIKPILGTELRTNGTRIVFLARNSAGYGKLCRLITSFHLTGKKLPDGTGIPKSAGTDSAFTPLLRILLAEGDPDLYILLHADPLLRLRHALRITPNLYLEIPATAGAAAIARLARLAARFSVPPVATVPVLFSTPDGYELHKVLTAIRTRSTVATIPPGELAPRDAYLRSGEEMRALFAASSVIRPGVAESGMMRQYIERHRGREKVTFLHPAMEEILAETHGVMIYQEDVMRVAHLVAGMTLAEADLLRRAMSGKMRSQQTMAGLKEKFAEAARARGIAAKTAAETWRQIESFAEYAFCKAHSASFALLSFQVAFLKAHWPAEFMAAVLSNGGGFYHTQAYLDEARRLGLKILPPDINRSEIAYSASPGLIRVGLMQVGELRRETLERLIASRRRDGFFTSLTEFYERVKPDRREAENLIACGAFDAYEFSRPELLCKLHLLRRSSPVRRFADSPPLPFPPAHTIIPRIPDYDEEMKRALEHKTLGVYVTCHPLALFAKDIGPSGFANAPTRRLADSRARRSFSEGGPVRRLVYIRADELAQHAGGRVELLGWLVCMKRVRTSKGEYMRFITMEDMTNLFEVVLFPRCYQRYGHLLNTPGPFVVSGRAENDSGAIVIKASRLRLLDTRRGRSNVQAQRAEGEKPLRLHCSALMGILFSLI